MNWKQILALVFVVSIALSAVASAVGLSYWAPLKSSMHAKIELDSLNDLLSFSRVSHRDVIYSFDVFWPLRPGKTTVNVQIRGLQCSDKQYTLEIVTMDGRVFKNRRALTFTLDRKDPFMYFHVRVDIPSTCRVLHSKTGPVVVVDARTK
ncbi:MAG: hypothetical protein GXO14_03215 [Thermococci archaeon]|nr:hypothetical protein [Thermococci archaeon]